jgi:hypothetical protein
MQFLEKNLEDIIFETPNQLLRERGLSVSGKKYRQVICESGIADLILIRKPVYVASNGESAGFHKALILVEVMELKLDLIDISTFYQALKYACQIKKKLDKRGIKYNLSITLIGRRISYDLLQLEYFLNHNESIFKLALYTYEYSFDGISFRIY